MSKALRGRRSVAQLRMDGSENHLRSGESYGHYLGQTGGPIQRTRHGADDGAGVARVRAIGA